MIKAQNLSKAFGHRYALRDLDLDVASGECTIVIGPNGAGKTTLLRILATLAKPSAGQAQICSLDLRTHPIHARRRIGYLGHAPLLYQDLSAQENLHFYARMYGIVSPDARIDAVLRRFDLVARRHDPLHTFSRGQAQRLAIARALLHDPDVLLMDEPYTGLDQPATAMLDSVILETCAAERAVLMTTHDLEHGWQLCQRADQRQAHLQFAFLIGGRIRFSVSAHETNRDELGHAYTRLLAGPTLAGNEL